MVPNFVTCVSDFVFYMSLHNQAVLGYDKEVKMASSVLQLIALEDNVLQTLEAVQEQGFCNSLIPQPFLPVCTYCCLAEIPSL
jgi:hypothetical protein